MGPLQGFTVIEMAGLGPCPMAGMMLADMGAEVIRVDRSLSLPPEQQQDPSFRGKKSIALNLKHPAALEALLQLVGNADALIEGYRPGVAERLGFAPEVCFTQNPKLVFGRMTGWGQDGPLAHEPGHDINYIAISGALHAVGRPGEKPTVPLNLVGDMGGGGMLLAFGVVCALLEAHRSGKGQVVDAAMIDGTAQLLWMLRAYQAAGQWKIEQRGINALDGGAHFYETYETADGKFVAIGALEAPFYAKLIALTGASEQRFEDQWNSQRWPELKAELTAIFKSRTREEWCGILEGQGACFAPVLDLDEAPEHPHNRMRNGYLTLDGLIQHAPAPRFSRTVAEISHGAHPPGSDGESLLRTLGYTENEIITLRRDGALLSSRG